MIAVFLLLQLVSASPKQYFLRFAETAEAISQCSARPLETDSLGREWSRYCYLYGRAEETVEFLREYRPEGWTYVVSGDLGEARFDYRVVERVQKCDGEETDGRGTRWKKVCYRDGTEVQFQRTKESPWTYVQDPEAGCLICDNRRIVHLGRFASLVKPYEPDADDLEEEIQAELDAFHAEYPSFLQQECLTLEGDVSGRYFWPDFTFAGEKLAYAKDTHGNYVWDAAAHRRILSLPEPAEVRPRTGAEAACPVLDEEGRVVRMEADQIYQDFFWKSQPGVAFQPALTKAQKAQGMYLIDSRTGRRMALSANRV